MSVNKTNEVISNERDYLKEFDLTKHFDSLILLSLHLIRAIFSSSSDRICLN